VFRSFRFRLLNFSYSLLRQLLLPYFLRKTVRVVIGAGYLVDKPVSISERPASCPVDRL
jgi:hypothetical protein